jgi:hypothetical protein
MQGLVAKMDKKLRKEKKHNAKMSKENEELKVLLKAKELVQ